MQGEPIQVNSSVRLEVVNEVVAEPKVELPRSVTRRGSYSGAETVDTSRESLPDDPLAYEEFWKQYKANIMKQMNDGKRISVGDSRTKHNPMYI